MLVALCVAGCSLLTCFCCLAVSIDAGCGCIYCVAKGRSVAPSGCLSCRRLYVGDWPPVIGYACWCWWHYGFTRDSPSSYRRIICSQLYWASFTWTLFTVNLAARLACWCWWHYGFTSIMIGILLAHTGELFAPSFIGLHLHGPSSPLTSLLDYLAVLALLLWPGSW